MPARAASLKAAGGQKIADARLTDDTFWKRADDSFSAGKTQASIAFCDLAARRLAFKLLTSIPYYELPLRGGILGDRIRPGGNQHFASAFIHQTYKDA